MYVHTPPHTHDNSNTAMMGAHPMARRQVMIVLWCGECVDTRFTYSVFNDGCQTAKSSGVHFADVHGSSRQPMQGMRAKESSVVL